jgi:hypothetical protein
MKHNGEIPEGMVIRHTCDNPGCINIDHLRIGTQADNVRDMYDRGRANHAKGARHGNAVLNEHVVMELRHLAKSISITELARHMGLDRSTVGYAVKGITWKHVT